MERHTLFQAKPLAEFQAFSKSVVAAINRAVAGLPRERVRLHMCWGNYNGPHECDEPIENLWPALQDANVGGFVISLANPSYRPSAHLAHVGCRLPGDWCDQRGDDANQPIHGLLLIGRLLRPAYDK